MTDPEKEKRKLIWQIKPALVSELIGMVQLHQLHERNISVSQINQAVDHAFEGVDVLHVRSFEHATESLCSLISQLFGDDRSLDVRRCAFNAYAKWHAARRFEQQQNNRQGLLSRAIDWISSAAGTE